MITSSIIFNREEPKSTVASNEAEKNTPRIVSAYRHERSRQEYTEVELNRAKIVTIDENGNLKRISLIPEH
jgi:hypothetical protein